MSSIYVRATIDAYIRNELPLEKIIDMTAEYGELEDLLEFNNVSDTEPWIGIQYVGSSDDPVSIGGENGTCYREIGAIYFHVVARVEQGVAAQLLPRIEAVISKFKGKRIDKIIVDGTTPPNFEASGTLEFSGGYTAGTTTISYHSDEK